MKWLKDSDTKKPSGRSKENDKTKKISEFLVNQQKLLDMKRDILQNQPARPIS